jgi:hypothetical protein
VEPKVGALKLPSKMMLHLFLIATIHLFSASAGWSIWLEVHVRISEADKAFNRQYNYAKSFVEGEESYIYNKIEISRYCFDCIPWGPFINYLDLFLGLRLIMLMFARNNFVKALL